MHRFETNEEGPWNNKGTIHHLCIQAVKLQLKWIVCVQMFANLHCVFCVWLDYNNISKFLNRILGIEVELQNKLFRFFTDTLSSVILDQKRRGTWDMGILGMSALYILHSLYTHFV